MSEHEEARERELLKRVLQYDIQDAVARYEAESRQRVSQIRFEMDESGQCSLEIDAKPGKAHAEPEIPIPRMIVLNLSHRKPNS
jgi:hypothetical protein